MKKLVNIILLICIGAIATSCSAFTGSTPETPTIPAEMLETSIAQTVIAQATIDAALNPPSPTVTKDQIKPTFTPIMLFPTLPNAMQTPGMGLTSVLTPIASLTPTKKVTDDAGQLISTVPAYNSRVSVGSFEDIILRVKNVGKTTWTTDYFYGYYSGDEGVGRNTKYNLVTSVKPGDEVNLPIDSNVSYSLGYHEAYWVFANADPFPNYYYFMTFKIGFTVVEASAGPTNTSAPATSTLPPGPPDDSETTVPDSPT